MSKRPVVTRFGSIGVVNWVEINDPGGPAAEVFSRLRRDDLRSRAERAIDRMLLRATASVDEHARAHHIPPAVRIDM